MAVAVASCQRQSPERMIEPVTHVQSGDNYRAMRSASHIVVAEILGSRILAGPRSVVRLGDHGRGKVSNKPDIPLFLARILVKTKLNLRGELEGQVELYSWIWNSGKHGGARLFHPGPGTTHIFFLTKTAGYLHTVGDYPGYDIPISKALLPDVLERLRATSDPDVFQRITRALLESELASATTFSNQYSPLLEGASLTSSYYVATLLDQFCHQMRNPPGRFAACMASAREFPGRCRAYGLAMQIGSPKIDRAYIERQLAQCTSREHDSIAFYSARGWPAPWRDAGQGKGPEDRRRTMLLYASALDPGFRAAACNAASAMTEAADISECRDRRGRNKLASPAGFEPALSP